MRKFIAELWALCMERYLTHRALRLLSKQEWSVEFLTALLVRASKSMGSELELTIMDKLGRSFKINTLRPQTQYKDDSIFNHLDDDIKIRQFMEQVNGL